VLGDGEPRQDALRRLPISVRISDEDDWAIRRESHEPSSLGEPGREVAKKSIEIHGAKIPAVRPAGNAARVRPRTFRARRRFRVRTGETIVSSRNEGGGGVEFRPSLYRRTAVESTV
jgi:hypothetical protein